MESSGWMTAVNYIVEHGSRCPWCRGPHLSCDDPPSREQEGEAVQTVTCLDCGAVWDDVMPLSGYEPRTPGRGVDRSQEIEDAYRKAIIEARRVRDEADEQTFRVVSEVNRAYLAACDAAWHVREAALRDMSHEKETGKESKT